LKSNLVVNEIDIKRLTCAHYTINAGATATETRYLWCGSVVCQARNSADVVTADYYNQGESRGNQTLYYIRDQLGSVVDVTDAQGSVLGSAHYGAYGATESASGIAPAFGYAGMLHNATTGLYLTQYRAYDTTTGRWLSRDPIGIAGGMNPYAYVNGNPISFIDPYGLSTFQIGLTLNFQIGPVNINGTYGVVADSSGNVGTYTVVGGGGGAGADAFGGVNVAVSNGACIQDLGGPFANESANLGAIAAGGIDVFAGQGSHGQPVAGGGFSVGIGGGAQSSIGGSQTWVTPLWP
jgi:RHS repeat-associated protein